MQVRYGPILAALALGTACSSSSKETRTASTEAAASQSSANASPSERPGADTARVLSPRTSQAMPEPAPRLVGGQLARADRANGTLTLNQAGGPPLVIVVTDDTQFVDENGQMLSQGLASLREGEQVRANLDPTSHRAVRIEVLPQPQPSK